MKKKILFLTVCFILSCFFAVSYASDRAVSGKDLPGNIKSFISSNFKNVQVASAEQDMDDGDYDVYLSNGIKVEFSSEGSWQKIDGNGNFLSGSYIPAGIKNHKPAASIKEIEKKYSGYKVKYSDGSEAKFDGNGKFLRYDD